MKKIRINDFYQEIEDEVITYDLNQYKDNILDIKKFYLHNLLSKTKIKYFITKLITFLVEIIDVLVLSYVLILDGDLTIELFVSVLGINILVGIVLALTPDFKENINKIKNEYNNI